MRINKYIIIFTCLLFMHNSSADEWTSEEKYREITYITIHTVDWLQTRTLAKQGWPDGRYETNPFLGKYPSTDRLDAHYLITSIGHIWISHLFPQGKWRDIWQYVSIIDSGNAVANNHRLGVRINF